MGIEIGGNYVRCLVIMGLGGGKRWWGGFKVINLGASHKRDTISLFYHIKIFAFDKS